ncbi:type II toxin-antitoxin system RelE/ParE family toxin [Polynucleobacter sp. AP-Latsch-80-C2]|uniref:type II toxin-antitoxin system RelE/ParE family toxin n=1 Tax=Polynucleobacter sp. AP-Latsch-80-C2 TaxID=2576931 RepID=UPI001C0C25FA|nr:type II toxin-antitoxin system RelE/ParE family toxin [Polynucleobacter sp. AP-Latsch-80-C2]MBU3623618.1 type II toxin-antitoxin system RelE/ParE family toxin [Polynucleobacter sp. AP-Latsch-80-C2]
MRLLVTATFAKATKKLHTPQKLELDAALKLICKDPEIGEAKVGDLLGVYVYKFRLSQQQCLLAYRILDAESIKLLTFGPHENFYRNLKRQDE